MPRVLLHDLRGLGRRRMAVSQLGAVGSPMYRGFSLLLQAALLIIPLFSIVLALPALIALLSLEGGTASSASFGFSILGVVLVGLMSAPGYVVGTVRLASRAEPSSFLTWWIRLSVFGGCVSSVAGFVIAYQLLRLLSFIPALALLCCCCLLILTESRAISLLVHGQESESISTNTDGPEDPNSV